MDWGGRVCCSVLSGLKFLPTRTLGLLFTGSSISNWRPDRLVSEVLFSFSFMNTCLQLKSLTRCLCVYAERLHFH